MKKMKLHEQIKTKIIALVIFSVVLTLVIIASVFNSRSSVILNNLVQNYMRDVVIAEGHALEKNYDTLGPSALSRDSLTAKYGDYQLTGMSSSYIYIVDSYGMMLFHPTADKIGSQVENDAVQGLIEQLKAGTHPEPDTIEYEYKGADKYAGYYVSADDSYIIILSADKKDAMSELYSLSRIILLLSLIPLVLCTIIAFIMSMKISKPIEQTVKRIDRLAELDLTAENGAKVYRGEVGLINRSVDTMKEKLILTIQNIKETSEAVNTNAANITGIVSECMMTTDNINTTVDELAKGAAEMAENTESTMRGVENIGNSIEDISEVTNKSLMVVDEATNIGDQSKNALQKLMDANADTKKSADDVAARIFEINQIVDNIQKATEMISSISSQTNLLSLNASIEAARAGEAGKGFAVVATEIKGLAEQSNRSAGEIADIVNQITTLVNNSVDLAKDIKEATEKEGVVLEDVSTNFDQVNGKLGEVADAVNTIGDRVEKVNADKQDILNAISNLSAISEENAASTQETSASIQLLADSMRNVSGNSEEAKQTATGLQDMISQFKI